MAEKKLGSDGNCALKIPTFLYRIKSTKYVLKLQKSEKYLLQMRKRVAMVVTRDPFLESPDNWRARKAVFVYMQDRSFNSFASNMIKLSFNETK